LLHVATEEKGRAATMYQLQVEKKAMTRDRNVSITDPVVFFLNVVRVGGRSGIGRHFSQGGGEVPFGTGTLDRVGLGEFQRGGAFVSRIQGGGVGKREIGDMKITTS